VGARGQAYFVDKLQRTGRDYLRDREARAAGRGAGAAGADGWDRRACGRM